MNLDTSDWKEFLLCNLFEITYGNKFDNNKMSHENPKINFVSRTEKNNGVSDVVDEVKGVIPYEEGNITIALGGSIGKCCIQNKPFYTSQNVAVCFTKHLSTEAKIFLSSIIMREVDINFCPFGRELNRHIKTDFSIHLPILKNELGEPLIDNSHKYNPQGYIPDYQWMENYIKSLNSKPITTKNKNIAIPKLRVDDWEYFYLGNLFDIKKGKRLTLEDQIDGNNNYIGAIDSNNGVSNKIKQAPIHKGNTISLSYNGSVGEAFYQKEPYWATDDVNALYPYYENFNEKIRLFIITMIRQEKFKFSYGRKWKLEKMLTTKIKLPIQRNNGQAIIDNSKKYSDDGYIPDWNFMENFIASLPYGDRI